MKQYPLVSIVLPTYNGAVYLETAIQSCLNQQYANWELIIVDDASTDTTPEIITRYSTIDPRIRSIRHETNQKLPAALNSGFSASRGQYLTWTSDDNLYRPNALSEMVQFLEAHSDIALVYADYSTIDETGKELQKVRVADYRDNLFFMPSVGPCFLYRRNVHDIIGDYDRSLFLAEDYDYWMRVAACFEMYPLHRNLYMYREHSRSLTEVNTIHARGKVREKVILQNLPKLKWLTPKHKSEAFLHLMNMAWERHERRLAAKYYLIAIRYNLWTAFKRSIYLILQHVLPKKFVARVPYLRRKLGT